MKFLDTVCAGLFGSLHMFFVTYFVFLRQVCSLKVVFLYFFILLPFCVHGIYPNSVAQHLTRSTVAHWPHSHSYHVFTVC